MQQSAVRSLASLVRPTAPRCRTFVSRTIGPSSTRHRVAAANARAAAHKRVSELTTPIPVHSQEDNQSVIQQSTAESITDKQSEFERRSIELLQQIHKGLIDMKEVNEVFDLKLNTPPGHSNKSVTLNLGPSIGSYEISADPDQRLVTLFSPASGVYHYEWSEVFEQWTSQTDQHFLLEILVRELLKYCRGVPKI